MRITIWFFVVTGFILLFLLGCENPFSDDDKETKRKEDKTYNPVINPEDFVSEINNIYYPLTPGTKFIYLGQSEDGSEREEVFVTHDTKTILCVTCTVIDDKVWLEDELIEATFDWYAQDKDGTVWYFGEDSKEYENGVVVSTEGSWEAGVAGAKPGIIMKANPVTGDSYRQEYYFNEAEDIAEVLGLNQTADVPYGSFTNCLKTKDWSPLEPDVIENKYYSPGIGLVLEVLVKGGSERMELVDIIEE